MLRRDCPAVGQLLTWERRGHATIGVVELRDSSIRRRLLIESLTELAAEPQAQVAWLDSHSVVTDEIALDFDQAEARRLARRVLVAELGEWQQPLPRITVIR